MWWYYSPWDEFAAADPEALGQLVRTRRVVDGRHALDADAYRAADWEVGALDRPARPGELRRRVATDAPSEWLPSDRP